MGNKFIITFIFAICSLLTAYATNPLVGKPVILPTCPVPTEQILRCLGRWACQHAIRLDLRCLLNLNGNPLLGGLLGGGGILGGANGGGLEGAIPGAGNGIVGGLLGR
ncbi:uncharacterized protein LOC124420331 [Lucilia cuprina]|uniref:uncharacterized protein LOC124420331 n=1 Tax=Lucilia cuprina TaxID=7375 RepID=UPI001F065099|nr:uncharacterized protein LOC124420331 [Lucilia cuprina]